MIGLPGETIDDLKATIQLNDEIGPTYLRISVYTPYPGTPLGNSIQSITTPISYFKGLDRLNKDMTNLAEEWLNKLKKEDRLWNDEDPFT